MSAFLCILFHATSARAYCQEVTLPPPANYDPVTQGCFDTDPATGLKLPLLFWKNTSVSYSLQRNASRQVSIPEATVVAAQAFAAWSNASCMSGGHPSITAVPLAPVDCSSVPSEEHNNPIIFHDNGWPYKDAANTLGYTILTVNKPTGEIYGATIEINSSDYQLVAPGTTVPDGGYDLASVLTHEAGHFLGLAHSPDQSAVMYAFYHAGSTALARDDVAGICSIYRPDGFRNGTVPPGCDDSSPRLGFLSECGSRDAGTPFICDGGAGAGDGSTDGGAATAFDGGDPCPSSLACEVAQGRGSRPAAAVCGLLVGLMAARRRRTVGRARTGGFVRFLGLALVVAGFHAIARDARASVSVGVLFEELLERASAAAIVTPLDEHALWENGIIVTYTRLRVDRPVEGRLPREIVVRTFGGSVGDIAQIVEGEATFVRGAPSLVFLRPRFDLTGPPAGTFGVVERGQGQFPLVMVDGQPPRLGLGRDIGVVLPPPPDHLERAAKRLADSVPPRLAREVLGDRPLDEALRQIALVWPRVHPGSPGRDVGVPRR